MVLGLGLVYLALTLALALTVLAFLTSLGSQVESSGIELPFCTHFNWAYTNQLEVHFRHVREGMCIFRGHVQFPEENSTFGERFFSRDTENFKYRYL